ncbi:MAG: FAD-binding protein [Clostridia bacterium]|nr:FAD-binding protein [Clostridia bacterium]
MEGLAEEIGVPADNLTATIEAYNAAYDAGEGVEFDVSNENMLPVRTAPFYAVALNPVAIGSLVGLVVTENCEVINNSGDVVENLYAVGEMCQGGNIATIYGGLSGVGTAIHTGRIAGEHAKDAIRG